MNTAYTNEYMGSLKECVLKLIMPFISIGVGIFAGVKDSPTAFYITVLLQAVSNIYDAFPYLSGYSKHIIIKELIVIMTSATSALIALFHFSGWSCSETLYIIAIIAICISLPIVSVFVDIWRMIRNNNI